MSKTGKAEREVREEIPTGLIIYNPDNPRSVFPLGPMNDLIESIKESGILVPLTVYRDVDLRIEFNDKKTNPYIILDGERRWRAAKKINLLTVPCYVLPKPASRMEYILSMFKIHNVREEWKLLPTAKKLQEIINTLQTQRSKAEKPSRITNKELAIITSLSPPTVSRCRQLLTVPKKALKLLEEEQKKEESGINPPKQPLTEDFFLEMLKPLRVFKSKKEFKETLFSKFTEEKIVELFIHKYKAEKIPNMTDFRLLSRIAKSNLSTKKILDIVTKILTDIDYTIDYAYDVYARPFYESTLLERLCNSLIFGLQRLELENLDPKKTEELLDLLKSIKDLIEVKISKLQSVKGTVCR